MPQELTDVLVEEPDLHDLDQMDDDEVENLLDVIFDSDDDHDDDQGQYSLQFCLDILWDLL